MLKRTGQCVKNYVHILWFIFQPSPSVIISGINMNVKFTVIYLNGMDDEISLQYGTIGNIDKQTHCQNVPNASNTFRMEQMYIIRQIYTLKVIKQVPR